MSQSSQDVAKKAAGEAAAALVRSGMMVGLGTGSTTAYAIEALGARVRDEGLSITGTPTSFAAERLARKHQIPLVTLDDIERIDLALDGADEVSPSKDLIKGRGAAHTREKVVESLAERFVVLTDPSKDVKHLGERMPVPVEVLPMAIGPVERALRSMGADVILRMGRAKDGPVVTDQGFWILDVHTGPMEDPSAWAQAIAALPGVLDHGLFLDMATDILIGHPDGSVEHRTRG